MGFFTKFEDKAESFFERSSGKGGIEPVKIARRAGKEMQREKMVGVGHEYAPTLYNVLLSPKDDSMMQGYYPTLAGEVETYLTSAANQSGLVFDCSPLVRFIVDDRLKPGKFDIVAENVSPATIEELRIEEMEFYGINAAPASSKQRMQTPPNAKPAFSSASAANNSTATPDPLAPRENPEIPHDAQDDIFSAPPVSSASSAPSASPEPFAAPDVPIQSTPAPAVTSTPAPPEAPHTPQTQDNAKTMLINNVKPLSTLASLIETSKNITHPINSDHIVIGRGSTCDVIISEPGVSRHHAEMARSASGWMITDTGSTNGVYVNGIPVGQSQLFNGDKVRLGNIELDFVEA